MNLDLEKVHDREVLLFLNMCKKEDGNFLNLPLKKRKIEDAVRLLCITTALSLRGPFFSVINAEEKRFDELISPLETNPLRRKESDRVARRLHRRRRRSPAETSRPRNMERKKKRAFKMRVSMQCLCYRRQNDFFTQFLHSLFPASGKKLFAKRAFWVYSICCL